MTIHNPISTHNALLAQDVPVHDASLLTGQNGTAHIVLDDKLYTLRITRAGKLILTK